MTADHHRRGYVLVMVSAVGFGIMPYFALDAYAAGLSVLSLLAYRFGVAAAVLVGYLAATRQLRRPTRRLLVVGTVLGLSYAAMSLMFFTSVRYIPPALSGLLLYAYPPLVALAAAVVARQAPSRNVVLALGLCVAGILLTVAPGQVTLGPDAGLGIAFGLAAPLIYTGYIVFSGVHAGGLNPWQLTTVVSVVASVALSLTGAITGQLQIPPPPAGWRAVLLVAIVSTVVAVGTFLIGVGIVGPTRASIVSTVEPVANLVVGALFYSFAISLGQSVGMALVLAGAALAMLAARVGASGLDTHEALG